MTTIHGSQAVSRGLPQGLRTAHEAMQLPEVQEMLRRLSEHKLGIFMPHMHDEQTGEFQLLPHDVVQVESGLEVSFRPMEDIAGQTERFLPVGWLWRNGAAAPVAACEMVSGDGPDDKGRYVKHKMPGAKQRSASSRESDQPAL